MRYVLSSIILVLTLAAGAQMKGSAKIYAYKQGSSRGAAPRMDEQGNVIHSNKEATYNYYLYLVSSKRVYPSQVWVDNTLYDVNYKKVNSPVEMENVNLPINTSKKVLVPKTSSTVLQLTPVKTSQGKSSFKLSGNVKANELVVIYKQNGRFYYSSLRKLPVLESAALQ
jgi:hypothetical protein